MATILDDARKEAGVFNNRLPVKGPRVKKEKLYKDVNTKAFDHKDLSYNSGFNPSIL